MWIGRSKLDLPAALGTELVTGQYVALLKPDFPIPPLAIDRREVVLKVRMRDLIIPKTKPPISQMFEAPMPERVASH